MSIVKKLNRPNIVLVITDQQTWNPNYKDGFPKRVKGKKQEAPFPAMDRLVEDGLVFNNAFCNACTCTSSRATLFTSTYPSKHSAKQVLAFDDPQNEQTPPKGYTQMMQGVMPSDFPNLFKMMDDAGYQVAYKGKWHVTKPTNYVQLEETKLYPEFDQLYWTDKDAQQLEELYGVKEWSYPDAGDDGNIFNFGGGDINNDGRFVDGKNAQSARYGKVLPGGPRMNEKKSDKKRIESSACAYLDKVDTKGGKKPFFLVVSLVNPHDVLSYPGDTTFQRDTPLPIPLYQLGGYRDRDFKHIEVSLPPTWNEDLKTKPLIQEVWRDMIQTAGEIAPGDSEKATNYLKFYHYLSSVVDKEINKVLESLDHNDLSKETLIVRISDHGDMGMSHGVQRQKMYNMYQQTVNVPMIFSHPLFKKEGIKASTESLASLIDIVPTLADIAGAKIPNGQFQGNSLVKVLEKPEKQVQKHVHFTYDDNYVVSPTPETMGPCHIRSIFKKEGKKLWKYAVYFDPDYGHGMQYEMYELKSDPDEAINLAFPKTKVSDAIKAKREELHQLLTKVMKEKGTLPDSVIWPQTSGADHWVRKSPLKKQK